MTLPENFTEMLKAFLTIISTIVRALGFDEAADEIDRRIADIQSFCDFRGSDKAGFRKMIQHHGKHCQPPELPFVQFKHT